MLPLKFPNATLEKNRQQKGEHENVTDLIEIKTPSPVLSLLCKQLRLGIQKIQARMLFMDMNRG